MKLFLNSRIFFLPFILFLFSACGNTNNSTTISSSVAIGTGSFVLNAAKDELTFYITVNGLSGPITSAHFHNAAEGSDGIIVRTITSFFSNGTASGVWKSSDGEPLTPGLVTELEAGRIYVNAHTSAFPSGEIRGQLKSLAAGEKGFTAKMAGTNEVPANSASGTGTGVFVLNSASNDLTFDITVTGLSGAITAAHFHNAPEGVSGLAVRTITSSFSNNTASGEWKNTDSESLTPSLVTELNAGRIYVNAHTSANPAGEIRGQLNEDTGTFFEAILIGSAEGTISSGRSSGY